MASFGWKRRIGEKVSKATSQQFEAEAADDEDLADDDDANWVHATKRRKEILIEDCVKKSKELKDEGANLAENRSYSGSFLFFCKCVFSLIKCKLICMCTVPRQILQSS
uniref:Uncharacterized protein n=1 Tax=Bubo bubo TaxID=30461 RepID=A0A8C0ERV9_BUBBB